MCRESQGCAKRPRAHAMVDRDGGLATNGEGKSIAYREATCERANSVCSTPDRDQDGISRRTETQEADRRGSAEEPVREQIRGRGQQQRAILNGVCDSVRGVAGVKVVQPSRQGTQGIR